MDRRSFLKVAGAAVVTPAVGGLLSACGGGDTKTTTSGGSTGAGTPKVDRKVKLGFIALTDAASIIMAKELGYFAERELDVTVEKQASWPATRDNLLNNQIDGGHVLFSMPMSVATGIGLAAGSTQSQALKIAMVLNNNGQAITLSKAFAEVGYALDPGSLEKVKALLEAKSPELAMTFPGGTHDTWLRYWLMAAKVDVTKLSIKPVPPPNMVANMEANAIDGYCVGEPWGAVAVKKGIGFTHLTSQDLWKHHPEKALVVSEKFATERPEVLKDVMGAVLKASQWLDNLGNRKETATANGVEVYVNDHPAEIEARLLGIYDMGGGLPARSYSDDYMTFYRDGLVNAPRRSHAIWFMSQYRRFGLLKEDPPFQALADSIILRDVYEAVGAAENVPVPDDDMAPFTIELDNSTFDPATPIPETIRV
ncbi:MAG: nitrate/nitrite transport system substrate-binding protein [Actinomycetota bacterium]|nr:nitrate/nitrite transport system substrate-binding protein [Actinomycetota bacterium]